MRRKACACAHVGGMLWSLLASRGWSSLYFLAETFSGYFPMVTPKCYTCGLLDDVLIQKHCIGVLELRPLFQGFAEGCSCWDA